MQHCSISIVLTMELLKCWTKPSKYRDCSNSSSLAVGLLKACAKLSIYSTALNIHCWLWGILCDTRPMGLARPEALNKIYLLILFLGGKVDILQSRYIWLHSVKCLQCLFDDSEGLSGWNRLSGLRNLVLLYAAKIVIIKYISNQFCVRCFVASWRWANNGPNVG